MNLAASYFLKLPEENRSTPSHAEFGGEVGAQESRVENQEERVKRDVSEGSKHRPGAFACGKR